MAQVHGFSVNGILRQGGSNLCNVGLASFSIDDYRDMWPVEGESAAVQSPPKPALKHARTELQSGSESRPIKRTSHCNNVTGNNLKYDG
jgi:hypothetical protein